MIEISYLLFITLVFRQFTKSFTKILLSIKYFEFAFLKTFETFMKHLHPFFHHFFLVCFHLNTFERKQSLCFGLNNYFSFNNSLSRHRLQKFLQFFSELVKDQEANSFDLKLFSWIFSNIKQLFLNQLLNFNQSIFNMFLKFCIVLK